MRKGFVLLGFIVGIGLIFSSCKKEDNKRIAIPTPDANKKIEVIKINQIITVYEES